jgi:hypothetical protein
MSKAVQIVALLTSASIPGIGADAGAEMVGRSGPSREWLAEQQAFLENREAPPANTMWKASLVALFAASAADMHSSLGKQEMNPLLRSAGGRFSTRGIAVKTLITGGAAAAQWLMVREKPGAGKYAAIANFGMSGVLAAAAVNNYGNRKAAPATLK